MDKDKVLAHIFTDLAKKHKLKITQIEDIFDSQFRFIFTTISALDFSNINSEEEFNKLKTNFNIPCIGKLHSSYKFLEYVRDKKKKAIEYHSRNDVQQLISNGE